MSRTRAILTLLGLTLLGLLALRTPLPSVTGAPGEEGDVVTYQKVVGRLRAHEPYYQAFGDELRRRHYALKEVFNWRTPIVLSFLAAVPDAVALGVLIALGAILCSATLAVVARPPSIVPWGAGLMQFGVLLTLSVPVSVVFSEAWAGVFVGLSVCAYALRRWTFAVPLGLMALFLRELAAPYCVVCTITAAVHRRWREVGAWLAGGCLYAVYYGWHLTRIWAHRLPTDLSHKSSWLEFRGVTSLMSMIHFQGWFLVVPDQWTAIGLVLIAAGILNARAPEHVRLTSAAYAVFFLVAGKDWDQYWGLMAWPVWALTCGYGVQLIADAIRTALATPKRDQPQPEHA